MNVTSYNAGQNNGRAKLTASQVEDIRRLYISSQFRIQDISKIFGISPSSAFRIVSCESWRSAWPCANDREKEEYMASMVNIRDGKRTAKITHDKAVEIVVRVHEGERQSDLANEYGVTRANLNNIAHGVQHNLAYREAMMRIQRGETWR